MPKVKKPKKKPGRRADLKVSIPQAGEFEIGINVPMLALAQGKDGIQKYCEKEVKTRLKVRVLNMKNLK